MRTRILPRYILCLESDYTVNEHCLLRFQVVHIHCLDECAGNNLSFLHLIFDKIMVFIYKLSELLLLQISASTVEWNWDVWIRDILVRIRIRGSVTLTYGSGSCFFRQWLTRCQQKIFFCSNFFLLITATCWRSSKIKSQEEVKKQFFGIWNQSHKIVEIMVFLTFLLVDGRYGSRSGSVQIMTDPDSGGPNIYGSSGSGSTTLKSDAIDRTSLSLRSVSGSVIILYLYGSGS